MSCLCCSCQGRGWSKVQPPWPPGQHEAVFSPALLREDKGAARVRGHRGSAQCAHRAGGWAAGRLEGTEVMCPQEVLGGLLHGSHVQITEGSQVSGQEEVASLVGLASPSHSRSHPHSLCRQGPASVSFKHRQLVRPGAAGGQAVQVGPGCGCVAGMEVAVHTEGLQDPVGGKVRTPERGLPTSVPLLPEVLCRSSPSRPPLPAVGEGVQSGVHLMAGCFRWVLRAWVRTSGEKGGWPERR